MLGTAELHPIAKTPLNMRPGSSVIRVKAGHCEVHQQLVGVRGRPRAAGAVDRTAGPICGTFEARVFQGTAGGSLPPCRTRPPGLFV